MENYPLIIFLVKYSLCAGLLYYTIKSKKDKSLLLSFTMTFIVLSLVVLGNFLLRKSEILEHDRPFYDITFIDFVFVVLIGNLFFKEKRNKISLPD
jgi:hypothetical protein